MKYGTICSKHESIIATSKRAQTELSKIHDLVRDVESFEQFKENIESAIIDSVLRIDDA